MAINMRDYKDAPKKIITRNRCRGDYRLAATVRAKAITKDKAEQLGIAINQAMRTLNLVGVVQLDYRYIKVPKDKK